MPRIPENGARIVFRSIVARISPTRASVCFCSAVARSYSAREITRSFSRPCIRSKLRRARSRSASTAASCACSCRVSSWTSTSPSRTDWPDSNAMRSTMPGQVGAHGDALDGGHRADRVERRRPRLLRRDDGRDGLGRWLEGGALRDGRLNLLKLHEAEGRDERSRHGQHQNHSFRHDFLFLPACAMQLPMATPVARPADGARTIGQEPHLALQRERQAEARRPRRDRSTTFGRCGHRSCEPVLRLSCRSRRGNCPIIVVQGATVGSHRARCGTASATWHAVSQPPKKRRRTIRRCCAPR